MDKRKNYSIEDKINMIKNILELAEKKEVNTGIEIDVYSYNIDNKEYNEILGHNQKYKLHEQHLKSNETRWAKFHNGYNKLDNISANFVVNLFKPKGGK